MNCLKLTVRLGSGAGVPACQRPATVPVAGFSRILACRMTVQPFAGLYYSALNYSASLLLPGAERQNNEGQNNRMNCLMTEISATP